MPVDGQTSTEGPQEPQRQAVYLKRGGPLPLFTSAQTKWELAWFMEKNEGAV